MLVTKEDVLRHGHALGMHTTHYADCDDCFKSCLDDYVSVCYQLMERINRSEHIDRFEGFIRDITKKTDRFSVFSMHPVHMIAEFLKIDHNSTEYNLLNYEDGFR